MLPGTVSRAAPRLPRPDAKEDVNVARIGR